MGNNAIKAKKINKLIENHKDLPISQLRNIGMIWAFELNSQVNIQKVVQSCVDNGLFIRPINRTIYFMPPYTINDFEMRHMIKTSEEAIKRHA
jgi:adenosylmethionine-8-amino-7-oxononanoate aminotransferase